jgi:hypothetical protein
MVSAAMPSGSGWCSTSACRSAFLMRESSERVGGPNGRSRFGFAATGSIVVDIGADELISGATGWLFGAAVALFFGGLAAGIFGLGLDASHKYPPLSGTKPNAGSRSRTNLEHLPLPPQS